MLRSVERLHQDQISVLASYREAAKGSGSVASLPRPGGVTAVTVYARVAQIVASDATYGPHLLVVRQAWSGTPPVPSDAVEETTRCYPTPNHAVADYVEDEIVRLVVAHSAWLAERLA